MAASTPFRLRQYPAAGSETDPLPAVRIAACYARAVALFVVNNETIAGLRAEGEGIAERIEGVLISTEIAGLFSAPLSAGRAFRRPPSEASDDVRLMRALGRSDACDVLVVPVLVRDRTVNLIYADNGPDRLADTAVAALVTLGSCLAKAYERLISTSQPWGVFRRDVDDCVLPSSEALEEMLDQLESRAQGSEDD